MKDLTMKQSNGFVETTAVQGQHMLYTKLRKEQPVVTQAVALEEEVITEDTFTVELPPASWGAKKEECKVVYVDFGGTQHVQQQQPKKKVNMKQRLLRKVVRGALQGGFIVGLGLLVMSLFWCNIGYNISMEEIKACLTLGVIPMIVGALPLVGVIVYELLKK